MANEFIKATKVVRTALGALARDVVLPQLVWRNAGGDFSGAYNDTISIRVPAYRNAKTRDLRARTKLDRSYAAETKVDVTLDKDVYVLTPVLDEEVVLDIESFADQIIAPQNEAIVRGLEDELLDTMTGATYTLEAEFSESDPYGSALEARKMLNLCNVPGTGRALAVGADIDQIILASLAKRESGAPTAENALESATIAGNYGGFRVVTVPGMAPDEAYAFHYTAFVLSTRAPVVPRGASWGATGTYQGFSIRTIMDYDPEYSEDRCASSCWVGSNVVLDNGELNDDGQFVPFETEEEIGSGTPILVRAVKLTLGS